VAVRLLSDAGLVNTDHGKGSFVRPLPPDPLGAAGTDRSAALIHT
jgi:DNA-binding GntR family transcriptional regulator